MACGIARCWPCKARIAGPSRRAGCAGTRDVPSGARVLHRGDYQLLFACHSSIAVASEGVFFVPPLRGGEVRPSRSLPEAEGGSKDRRAAPPLPPLCPSRSRQVMYRCFAEVWWSVTVVVCTCTRSHTLIYIYIYKGATDYTDLRISPLRRLVGKTRGAGRAAERWSPEVGVSAAFELLTPTPGEPCGG